MPCAKWPSPPSPTACAKIRAVAAKADRRRPKSERGVGSRGEGRRTVGCEGGTVFDLLGVVLHLRNEVKKYDNDD